jgi:hypothetical protein
MLFHELMEYIFHVSNHRMIDDELTNQYNIDQFHSRTKTDLISFRILFGNSLLEMDDNKQHHLLDVRS